MGTREKADSVPWANQCPGSGATESEDSQEHHTRPLGPKRERLNISWVKRGKIETDGSSAHPTHVWDPLWLVLREGEAKIESVS